MSLILKITRDSVTSYRQAKWVSCVRKHPDGPFSMVAYLEGGQSLGSIIELIDLDSFSVLPEDYEEVDIHANDSASIH